MSLAHNLESRAQKLRQVREFFHKREYLELDPPSLSPFAVPTPYIEPIKTSCKRYLHTSPEIEMKKILSKLQKNCYFLGHVFRSEEVGPLHSEEFTMIEYYKIETNKEAFLNEVIELINLFITPKKTQQISYQRAFDTYVPKNYEKNPEIAHLSATEKRHWAWAIHVEKNLNDLTIITDFPKEDASLAKLNEKGCANRFEIYYNAVELANAFEELTDPIEQKTRFDEDNDLRQKLNQELLPYDQAFIDSLASIPKNTFGIALGFDRLMKLHQSQSGIKTHNPQCIA